ncbi:MAG: tol-pal system protein YbgF [Burkholderiales bacterium]
MRAVFMSGLGVKTVSAWALVLIMALTCAMTPLAAQAALFSDDEARRAILDLRKRVDENNEAARARQIELLDQISQLRRSLLELNTQIEQLRAEMARMRGQDEQLAREVSELQRKQRDVEQGVDERMRRIEPQKVSVDGKEFLADPDEKRSYEAAMDTMRKADFAGAVQGFAAFLKRYPASGYAPSAYLWLGNAHYGKREYKEAIAAFRAMMANAPDSVRVPEALLSIANCQIELKDTKAARKTLDDLVKAHPKSEAAQAARERLATLK